MSVNDDLTYKVNHQRNRQYLIHRVKFAHALTTVSLFILPLGQEAHAGSCGAVGNGRFYCLGVATPSDQQQNIYAIAPITVDAPTGFSISAGPADVGISIGGQSGVTYNVGRGTTVSGGIGGLFIRNASGDMKVTTGNVSAVNTARSLSDAINIGNSGTGSTFLDTTAGTVTATGSGILLQTSDTAGAITVKTGDVHGGASAALNIATPSNADITIDTSKGSITSGTDGIHVQSGGGRISATVGDVASDGQANAVH